jgi:fructoselysine-6-P-deglycase FrlB-like protein
MSELDHTLVPIAPDLEATVQEALDQRQAADDIVAAALDKGLDNVYLVGCGGSHIGTFPAHDLLDRYGSAFASYKVQSAEFTSRAPAGLGPRSLVVAASHSGNTPETVAAAKFAKEKGATVVGIAITGENGLAAASDVHLNYSSDITATEPKLVHFAQIALALLEQTGDGEKAAPIRRDMGALPEALKRTKEEIADRGEQIAEALADSPLTYIVGAGASYGSALMMAWCYFQEMQWIHAAAINGGDFFHGPFEMAGQQTTLIALLSEDASRPLNERVLRFANTYVEDFYTVDTADLTLPNIGADARPDLSQIALFSAERRVLDHVAARRGHDTSQRRFMWKVEY